MILLNIIVKLSTCSEASARSLDVWRPLSHSPYQQKQFYQNSQQPGALISYAHFDKANKEDIVEAAKHNAEMLKKYKEISHQPITSYSDPYQLYSQTLGPTSKYASTVGYSNSNLMRHQHQVAAASSHILSRIPYPGKSASLYQTKLNYLGKPDSNSFYHQNSVHQTDATTPKVAGYTTDGRDKIFHYHHPSFGMTPISSTTKRIPTYR